MSDHQETLTCVTGASGFIGTHVVRELLERGHRVRATVRDTTAEAKTEHLRALPGAGDRLELFSADLMKPGGFDEAIAGCEWVFHVASAVFLNAKNPQVDIVDPAIEGTANVLDSIEKAGTVERVGLTSSVAAVYGIAERKGHVYTEDDWCEDATVKTAPYPLGKTRAEKSVWARKESLGFDLTVVNPTLVLGPVLARVHLRSSPSSIRSLACGEYPAIPKLAWGMVDVRDVADALITGVERGANGRFILTKKSMWMPDIARWIKAHYPDLSIATRAMPNFLAYLAPLFDRRVSLGFLRRNLGRMEQVDNSKVQRELDISLRPLDDTLRDTIDSMITGGYVPAKKK